MCGWTLARAHARTGDRIAIAAYLGPGPVFDEAVADFAVAYADQTERDHRSLQDAIAVRTSHGRVRRLTQLTACACCRSASRVRGQRARRAVCCSPRAWCRSTARDS
jgi:hypothetical protein